MHKTRPGFLIVETLIAITILIMVSATSISLVVMGFHAININRHSLKASWLAQETVESLRILRDTNYLRFGYDKENCWTVATTNKCLDSNAGEFAGTKTSPAYYTLVSFGGDIFFHEEKAPLNLKEAPDSQANLPFLLYYQDIDPTIDYDGDGINNNDKQYLGAKIPTLTLVGASKYYRQIETYMENPNQVEAVVTIGWYEGSTPHTIKLPVTLTNYQLEE